MRSTRLASRRLQTLFLGEGGLSILPVHERPAHLNVGYKNENMGCKLVTLGGEQGEAMSGSESRFPKSLIEFQGRFASESACAEYLFERRWPQGFVCPGCSEGRAWRLKT